VTDYPLANLATKPVSGLLLLAAVLAPTWSLAAQDFTPPDTGEQESQEPGIKIGLYGFSTRLGWDFEEDGGGAILSVALDLGNLGLEQLRLRPSVEIGFAEDVDTYVVNGEVVYRFTPDTEKAVPYVGLGVAIAGRDDCSTVPSCPEAWLQFALGFELTFRDNLNWTMEYHAEDALRRHRLFVGLSTRRGG
jgi:hypothetical protein